MRHALIVFWFIVASFSTQAQFIPFPYSGGGGTSPSTPINSLTSNICSSGNTVTFGTNLTAGNSLVVVYEEFNSQSVTISDSQSNSYTTIASNAAAGYTFYVWVATNVAGGAETITVTNNFGCNEIVAYEFTGLVTSSVGDGATLGGASSLPSSFTTGSVTTAHASDVVLTYMGYQCGGCGSFVPTVSGYTLAPSDGNIWVGYKSVSSTGTYSATWTPSPVVVGTRTNGYGVFAVKRQ